MRTFGFGVSIHFYIYKNLANYTNYQNNDKHSNCDTRYLIHKQTNYTATPHKGTGGTGIPTVIELRKYFHGRKAYLLRNRLSYVYHSKEYE